MQKRFEELLEKYGVNKTATLLADNRLQLGDKVIPLLPWRKERRFEELKKLVEDETVSGVSVFRTICIGHRSDSLEGLLYRELDICRWILGSEVAEVFAIKNKNAINVSAKLQSGVVCTLELAATLPEEQERISKHEIITRRGIACDMNVDTQVMQSSVYVMGEDAQTYTDVDFELFGLSIEEVALVRSAFAAAKEEALAEGLAEEDAKLRRLVEICKQSARDLQNGKGIA